MISSRSDERNKCVVSVSFSGQDDAVTERKMHFATITKYGDVQNL